MKNSISKADLDSFVLDFNLESPIKSYNYTSFIGGALFAKNKEWYPYYLSKHILLLSNNIFDVSCDDMLMYEDKNVFEDVGFDKEIINNGKIKEFIIDKLKNGYYASVTIDEFYIPNRYAYERKCFYHDMLIYGFDLTENVFYTAGYDNTGRVSMIKYDIDLIVVTISKCLKERKSKPFFHFYKCKKCCLGFEVEKVKTVLNKYINCEPISKKKYDGKYGIAAYEGLISRYKYSCKNSTYWRKASFDMLCEHKKLMLDRINYLNTNHEAIDAELIHVFEEVFKTSKSIQANSIKYEITKNEKVLHQTVDKIKEIADIEQRAIEKLLRSI